MEQFHSVNVDASKVGTEEIVWVCFDTPVDELGYPDSKDVLLSLNEILPRARSGTVVLISTQMPVGSCDQIQEIFPQLKIAYSPENLRRGRAINDFLKPERIIVGCADDCKPVIEDLFKPINAPILWMSVKSSEMVKHALNTFLALSVAYINEIDKVSVSVGAVSSDVSRGLQTDKRIGALSYLKAGGPYTNDTLGREVHTLIDLDKKFKIGLTLIPAIKKSNDEHSNNRK
jgi:UDPglucose 6-dehydrogenase